MTNWGWDLPPGVTDRDTDGPEETPECTCEETRNTTCPIHGFCPKCGDFTEDGPCTCTKPAPAIGAQDAKAFAALDALPAGDRLPLERLFSVLAKFGHSDAWALRKATDWYRANSKLWKPLTPSKQGD